MKCSRCGAPMEGNKCEYCGNEARSETAKTSSTPAKAVLLAATSQMLIHAQSGVKGESTVSPKNRWVAFVLCFFLGFFGVHYFYVGKTKFGILYLCTIGLFGYGVIVDCVRIAIGKFRDKNGLSLK